MRNATFCDKTRKQTPRLRSTDWNLALTPIYSFYGALTNSKDGGPGLVIFIITLKRVNLTAQ